MTTLLPPSEQTLRLGRVRPAGAGGRHGHHGPSRPHPAQDRRGAGAPRRGRLDALLLLGGGPGPLAPPAVRGPDGQPVLGALTRSRRPGLLPPPVPDPRHPAAVRHAVGRGIPTDHRLREQRQGGTRPDGARQPRRHRSGHSEAGLDHRHPSRGVRRHQRRGARSGQSRRPAARLPCPARGPHRLGGGGLRRVAGQLGVDHQRRPHQPGAPRERIVLQALLRRRRLGAGRHLHVQTGHGHGHRPSGRLHPAGRCAGPDRIVRGAEPGRLDVRHLSRPGAPKASCGWRPPATTPSPSTAGR